MITELRHAVGHYDMLRRAGAIYDDALAAAAMYLRRKVAGRIGPAAAIQALVNALKLREDRKP